jgi:glycosyltransferase involved in cell wall biosynthesis
LRFLRSGLMSDPVRCAIVPPVPVPYREPLFARLRRRGRVDPIVIYQSGEQPGWDQPAGWFPERHPYRSVVLKARQRARPGRSPVLVPRGLGAALRRVDPHCVVSWEYGPATLRALAWCAPRRRPLVIFSELTPATAGELSPARRLLHRALAPRAAGLVAASSAARERFIRLGADPARIEISIQAADVARFKPVRERPRGEGPVRIITVGRLVEDKNVRLLIEAFAQAGLEDGRAELAICGTGPLEAELRATAERLGVPARFLGYLGPDELPDAYAAADALALVSTYEPFGVAVREAAEAGLPIVCSRVAGAAGEIAVEGRNALLVDPGSREEVAAALRRLVGDPRLRARMSAESAAVADAHPPEADAEAFERAVLRAAGHA